VVNLDEKNGVSFSDKILKIITIIDICKTIFHCRLNPCQPLICDTAITVMLPHKRFLCSICLIKSTWNDLQWDQRHQKISTVTPLQTDLTPLGRSKSTYSTRLAGLVVAYWPALGVAIFY